MSEPVTRYWRCINCGRLVRRREVGIFCMGKLCKVLGM